MGDSPGHLLRALLIAAILVLTYAYFSTTRIDYRRRELLAVGTIWALVPLTLFLAPLAFGSRGRSAA